MSNRHPDLKKMFVKLDTVATTQTPKTSQTFAARLANKNIQPTFQRIETWLSSLLRSLNKNGRRLAQVAGGGEVVAQVAAPGCRLPYNPVL